MPITGMQGNELWAFTTDEDEYSYAVTVYLPGVYTVAQIGLGDQFEPTGDQSSAWCGITSVTFQQRTIDFEDTGLALPHIYSADRMTIITFKVAVRQCWATAVWTANYWD